MRYLTVLVLLAGGIAVAIAWLAPRQEEPVVDGGGAVATGVAQPDENAGNDQVREEFLEIARRLWSSDHPYYGMAKLRQRREELARVGELDTAKRFEVESDLVHHLLRFGEVDEAVQRVEALSSWAADLQGYDGGREYLKHLRALVYLRKSEVENCIRRHNSECCIFPLAGGGLHSEARPAERARDELLSYLKSNPREIDAAWLLNIACMALGEYPGGVPEEHRIPPASLASEVEFPRFVDVAPETGTDTFDLAGGAVIEDFDGDGWLDIASSTIDPGEGMKLFANRGDGRFEARSVASGLSQQLGALAFVSGDHDGDGDADLVALRGAWYGQRGEIRKSLLQNQGDGRFLDVTRAAGLAEPARPSQTAAWGDYDGDGDLDLYVGCESQGEQGGSGSPEYACQLFANDGKGHFTDVAAAAGVTNDRYCKGVAWGDYDNDGDLDLYCSNFGFNRLYQNRGDGTFIDVAGELGVQGVGANTFATWFFDYDNDGWLDLFMTTWRAGLGDYMRFYRDGKTRPDMTPTLYKNEGGRFRDVTSEVGLARVCLPMGAGFGDLDNDGWLDVYLATGSPDFATLVPNLMLRNDRGRFQDVTQAGGFGHLQKGHGLSFADLDHDGDEDIYLQVGGFYPGDRFSNVLFANPGGFGNHYVALELVGTRSPRCGSGARVKVVVEEEPVAGGAATQREIHRAPGCVSSFAGSPRRLHIGLGRARRVVRIEVRWPRTADVQVVADVPLDCMLRVTEGRAGFELLEAKSFSLGQ